MVEPTNIERAKSLAGQYLSNMVAPDVNLFAHLKSAATVDLTHCIFVVSSNVAQYMTGPHNFEAERRVNAAFGDHLFISSPESFELGVIGVLDGNTVVVDKRLPHGCIIAVGHNHDWSKSRTRLAMLQ